MILQGYKSDTLVNLIFALKVRKMIRKGCEAYLTYVRDVAQLE